MTKSPPDSARMALSVARESIPAYSSKSSGKGFAPRQHFALLALRESLRTEYRGPEQILKGWAGPRQAIGLKKVAGRSTMQKAAERPLEKGGSMPSDGERSAAPGRAA